ncbi:hypothetical protein HYZ99_04675 [Candidatus Peregrinibacteria bacterium]|nr:hypothetical protein [Candidatus Peregrinibacteria bacterium]
MTGDALIKRLERMRERVTGTQILSLEELRRIARFELDPLLRESAATATEYDYRSMYAKGLANEESRGDPTYHRLHIRNFEKIMQCAKNDSDQIAEDDYNDEVVNCRNAIEDVCTEMLLFLVERKEKKVPPAKWAGDNRLFYDGDEYLLPKKAIYTSLCREMFTSCRQVGSGIEVSDLYKTIRSGRQQTDPMTQYHWIHDMMRSANRWAKQQKKLRDLPEGLLRMDGKKVTRLI